jgi:hypothetical protein
MPEVPVIGQPAATNNPLVVLNAHLAEITAALRALNAPKAAVYPHRYGIAEANDPGGHGRVWGAYCLACSQDADEYVYPCQVPAHEMLDTVRPPAFFTVGDVFEIDDKGRMVRYVPPA